LGPVLDGAADRNDPEPAGEAVGGALARRRRVALEATGDLEEDPDGNQWSGATNLDMAVSKVLSTEDEQHWRRFERGLVAAQLGEAVRPYTTGDNFDGRKESAEFEAIRDEHGTDWSTAICPKRIEDDVRMAMKDAGVEDPTILHYGDLRSRNDFDGESVGLVIGSIDPGDGHVMETIARRDLDARPARSDICCKHCGDRDDAPTQAGTGCQRCSDTGWERERGRAFVGDDAEEAQKVLDNIRVQCVLQAAGRYARSPSDPDDQALVYVATSVLPDEYVDAKVPGAFRTFTGDQRDIIEVLRHSVEPMSTQAIATEADVTPRYVRQFLNELADENVVERNPREGPNGATMYASTGHHEHGLADISGAEEDAAAVDPERWNTDVQGLGSTWSFRCSEPSVELWPSLSDEDDETAAAEDCDTVAPPDDDASADGPPPG